MALQASVTPLIASGETGLFLRGERLRGGDALRDTELVNGVQVSVHGMPECLSLQFGLNLAIDV